ncbi:hypothetical protein FACS1894219_09080 [Clostridia bacterium]|nr:hypothetical protein FACS1894219_09080 [Clostridia bacterium]
MDAQKNISAQRAMQNYQSTGNTAAVYNPAVEGHRERLHKPLPKRSYKNRRKKYTTGRDITTPVNVTVGKNLPKEYFSVAADLKTKYVTKAAVSDKPFPLSLLFAAITIAAVIIIFIYSMISLYTVNTAIDNMKRKIDAEITRGDRLDAQLERKNDLVEFEKTAVYMFNMVGEDKISKKKYIGKTPDEKNEIFENDDSLGGMITKIQEQIIGDEN